MNKTEFSKLIDEERKLYLGELPHQAKQMKKIAHKRYYIWKYLYYFRCCQYFMYKRKDKNVSSFVRRIAKIKFNYYNRRKNIYSYKSGVEIGINSKIGRNCDIWHSGVVINGNVGDNCVFHGNNTLGNKGIGNEKMCPNIGNNVDIGVGAIIIGNVNIADGCIIGAGAVVTKSFDKKSSVIVGVPGKAI